MPDIPLLAFSIWIANCDFFGVVFNDSEGDVGLDSFTADLLNELVKLNIVLVSFESGVLKV